MEGGKIVSEHILENEFLRVTIADAGAELISVWDKVSGQERIWTGEPAISSLPSAYLFIVRRMSEWLAIVCKVLMSGSVAAIVIYAEGCQH